MSEYLIYILKVSACFTLLYFVFYLFFRKLTFHQLNRAILLLIIVSSIVIPLVPTMDNHSFLPEKALELVNFEYTDTLANSHHIAPANKDSSFVFTWVHLLIVTYCVGFLFALYRFCDSILKLLNLKNNAAGYTIEQFQFFITDVPSVFSFANWIFIPNDKPKQEAPIIEHEKAHARFKHTIDLIIVELYIMICWFNPFVYFFRKSLRTIHEFQADEAVIKKQVKKSLYLGLLLNELNTNNTSKLYSYFNHPIIKNRVDMIMKPNSNRKNILRYSLLMPAVFLLLTAFTKQADKAIVQNEDISFTEETIPTFIFPVPNYSVDDISAPFGIERKNPITKLMTNHGGIDIKAAEGESVIASAEGVVSTAIFKPNWGNLIVISHSDGYQTWYAHLQGFNVSEGQTIEKGALIGWVGETGRATGPHLHFEMRLNDERLDPLNFMAQ